MTSQKHDPLTISTVSSLESCRCYVKIYSSILSLGHMFLWRFLFVEVILLQCHKTYLQEKWRFHQKTFTLMVTLWGNPRLPSAQFFRYATCRYDFSPLFSTTESDQGWGFPHHASNAGFTTKSHSILHSLFIKIMSQPSC